MTLCDFKKEYFNQSQRKRIVYSCDEEALSSSKYCIFHDNAYFKSHEDESIKRLMEKIKVSNSKSIELLCIGYYIPNFRAPSVFRSDTYFEGSIFYGEADFSGVVFKNYVNFSSIKFNSNADFSNAEFRNFADFRESEFYYQADFHKCKFYDEAFFPDTKFYNSDLALPTLIGHSSYCIFYDIEFIKRAVFVKAEFNSILDISGCIFHGEAVFHQAKFRKETYAMEIVVETNADFSGSYFDNEVYFTNAKFVQELDFTNAHLRKAFFYDVTFQHDLDFSDTIFLDETSFEGSRFLSSSDFYNTQFHSKTNFREYEFQRVSFMNTIFNDELEFDLTRFHDIATFIGSEFNVITKFDYVIFDDSERILFDVEDMSSVSFLGTDISRVRFGDQVSWKGEAYQVVNEQMITNSPEQIRLGTVLAIYRNLRENYEFRVRYEEAGKFFIKEMELKRRYREAISDGHYKIIKNGLIRRNFVPLAIYNYLCKYGEDYRRPLFWMTLLLSFSVAYWLGTVPYILPPPDHLSADANVALERSLSDIFQLRNTNMILADYAFRILSIPILGTLFIALRRKFERRFRH